MRPLVLVIDDNRRVLASLARGLRGRGFDTAQAATYAAACTSLASLDREPVGVLVDLILDGGRSGFEVGRFVRERYGSATALVVMTAYPIDSSVTSHASRLGAHLRTKPLDLDALVTMLVQSGIVRLLPGMTEIHRAILQIATDYALNPQEIRVVAGLTSGMTRAELPARLGLNENTIKWQVRQLLAKTSTTTTTQLMSLVATSVAKVASFQ